MIYGVNTGFGGSADTRTEAIEELQREVIRGLHYGILVSQSDTRVIQPLENGQHNEDLIDLLSRKSSSINDAIANTCMPKAWVKASMLIRLNSLASGASGVKLAVVDTLVQLLNKDITPHVPLRGSISASGDLSPLSYIAGVMQGKPSLTVWTGEPARVTRADIALAEVHIQPIKFGPKEGLAIVNGTAASAAVAAIAVHEVLNLAMLSQVLTAMAVETLCGTDESFDPLFAQVRPHMGQKETAQNVFSFLQQSRLVYRSDGSDDSLRQDRYSIRTASQWLGPVLEDLVLAYKQITTEINSSTDNPLIDSRNRILHGGNFQAMSVTSAVEKARRSCQVIGRMQYVQCTEMFNPATNRGLPPNLVVDEPSVSFLGKGLDIMIAALQSELGFLANPVDSHVQSAEMGNQALNSLALISSRYTIDSADILMQLSSVHILALCQALDLRAMHIKFMEDFKGIFCEITRQAFDSVKSLEDELWAAFEKTMSQTTSMDSEKRFSHIMTSLQPNILEYSPTSVETLSKLINWKMTCSKMAFQTFTKTRSQYLNCGDARSYLGSAAQRVYGFVRRRLGVPFFGEDILRTPNVDPSGVVQDGYFDHRLSNPTVGSFVTAIYDSLRSGALYAVVLECLESA